MKRIKLKKNKNIPPLTYILIIIFMLIISLILSFNYLGKNINPKIQSYAEMQARKITSVIFSQSINDEIISIFEDKELLITNENNEGTVSSIDFNSVVVNKALLKISSNVKGYLKKLETGQIEELGLSDEDLFNVDDKKLKNGVVYEVPTGIIFNNGLLSNIGPKIPVKLKYLGNVTTDIVTDISDYGINNAIVKIGVKIVVKMQVVLPYSASQIDVESTIPITIKLIQGTVPNYYFGGDETPSLSIDMD